MVHHSKMQLSINMRSWDRGVRGPVFPSPFEAPRRMGMGFPQMPLKGCLSHHPAFLDVRYADAEDLLLFSVHSEGASASIVTVRSVTPATRGLNTAPPSGVCWMSYAASMFCWQA